TTSAFPFVYGHAMNLDEILKSDKNIETLISAKTKDVTYLTDLDHLNENALVVLGDKKFLNKFIALQSKPKVHVIIHEKLASEEKDLESVVLSLSVSKNIPVTISVLSKIFFDQKTKNLNHWHDGRQNGSAS